MSPDAATTRPTVPSLAAVVTDALGIEVAAPGSGDGAAPFLELAGLALRDNPRRAHLIVSKILGKHVPVDPRDVLAGGHRLGDAVATALAGAADDALVVGYCETATGLGHAVAERLGAPYLHTTRRPHPALPVRARFDEEHSHAVAHLVQPTPAFPVDGDGPLVLVDDELTSGRTALNTVAALHALHPRSEYVVAALLDARTPEAREAFDKRVAELGVRVTVASLLSAHLTLPADVLERAARARPQLPAPAPVPTGPEGDVHVHAGWWPGDVPVTARHGMTVEDTQRLAAAAGDVARRLADVIGPTGRSVLVVGTEELLHLPTRVAAALAGVLPDASVLTQSTTRSPVHAADDPEYAVRRTVTFPAPDEPTRESRLHNVVDPRTVADGAWSDLRYDHVVVVVDAPAADCAGLVGALRPFADHVHLVPVSGPDPAPALRPAAAGAFGSYPADDVTWLLTDLSAVPLERGTEDREEAIQRGVHYSEMLPVEYQPDADYIALFHEALAASADRLATAVGVVGELVWDAHGRPGQPPVLVSLARAGTPIGVLLRRWFLHTRGIDVPHYTISIIRGRGIDEVALAHVLDRHPAAAVAFVDGWTGKGAIQRQLTDAVTAWRASHPEHAELDDRLAVLADPGSCTPLFGTRDDFLIPSACLNSTVSGLVSRTVHRADLIGPGMFHGAKYYPQWSDVDVSRHYVDTVAARFAAVADDVAALLREPVDRTPTWAGWRSIEEIAADHGITDVNLVKPGVGETTRVLLRRVPWQVLVHPDRTADLTHVLVLARARGVPVVEVPGLPYSCVGLIRQVV